jgi:competence protein ComEA
MNNDIRYFTRAERQGIVVLIGLCVVLFLAPAWLPDRSQSAPTDFSALRQQVADWQAAIQEPTADLPPTDGNAATPPQPFEPNSATREQLAAVGLSPSSIRSWLSFTRKGARFNKWADIENFRALSPEERTAVQPYLLFPEANQAPLATPDAQVAAPLQNFNPNEVSLEDLLAMGIPERAARSWINYLAGGGHFREPAAVGKIYNLAPADFARLQPYLTIPTAAPLASARKEAIPQGFATIPERVVLDINQATTEEWQQLRGIGPGFSRRIIQFREQLGGFSSVEQVRETYGLPDSVFQSIYLQLRPSPILRTLRINRLNVQELAAHPYLRFNDAKLIVQYREAHGAYQSGADLEKLYGLSTEVRQKIAPYLSFE